MSVVAALVFSALLSAAGAAAAAAAPRVEAPHLPLRLSDPDLPGLLLPSAAPSAPAAGARAARGPVAPVASLPDSAIDGIPVPPVPADDLRGVAPAALPLQGRGRRGGRWAPPPGRIAGPSRSFVELLPRVAGGLSAMAAPFSMFSAGPHVRAARAAAPFPAVALLAVAGLPGPASASMGTCAKVVYCLDGQAYSDADYSLPTEKTCADECAGNCCLGEERPGWGPCDKGRFPVCADQGDGSCDGELACFTAGDEGGSVGLISGGSCVGLDACNGVGYMGSFGDISGGSCVGDFACQNAGNEGSVGNIADSCRGKHACQSLGMSNGQFPSLDNCCNSDFECIEVGCLSEYGCSNPPPSLPETCPAEFGSSSAAPSETPSMTLTGSPSAPPSVAQTKSPSASPSAVPIDVPSDLPSGSPSTIPSKFPTKHPSGSPTAIPSDAPSGSPSAAEYYVVCGAGIGGSCPEDDERVVGWQEQHQVRCCRDTAGPDWRQPRAGCDVWSRSAPCREADLPGAREFCQGIGGRLCTMEELGKGCTMKSGCGFDRQLVWSSTPSLPSDASTGSPSSAGSTSFSCAAQQDLQEAKEDLQEVKEDQQEVKEDLQEVKEDLQEVKEELQELREDVKELRNLLVSIHEMLA